MAQQYKTGIVITGDASGGVRAVELTRGKLNALNSTTGQTVSANEKLRGSLGKLTSAFGGLQSIIGTLSVGLMVREFVRLADAGTRIENQLRLVTDSAADLASVQQRLAESARRTFSSFEGTVTVFSRLARSTEDLGVSQETLLQVTETINQAITLSGVSAESANAALIQLSQGMASGVLRGEELNSVMEQTPRLAQAIAEGMGVTIGQLRELGKQGQITTQALVDALTNQSEVVSSETESMTATVSQAWTVLYDSIGRAVDVLNDGTGASSGLAEAMIMLGGAVESFARNILPLVQRDLERIRAVIGLVTSAVNILRDAWVALSGAMVQGVGDLQARQQNLLQQIAEVETRLENSSGQTANRLRTRLAGLKETLGEVETALKALNTAANETAGGGGADTGAGAGGAPSGGGGFSGIERSARRLRPVLSELTEEFYDLSGALGDFWDKSNDLSGAIDPFWGDMRESIGGAVEETQKLKEESADVPEFFRRAAESIYDSFRDAFRSIFENGLDGFGDFVDAIKRAFLNMLADLATLAIRNPIILPTIGFLGGMLGLDESAIASVTGQMGGAGGGGLGLLSGAGSLISSILGGGGQLAGGLVSSILSGVGAPAGIATGWGAAASAVVPWLAPIGIGIGLLSSLFGDDPHYGFQYTGPLGGGRFDFTEDLSGEQIGHIQEMIEMYDEMLLAALDDAQKEAIKDLSVTTGHQNIEDSGSIGLAVVNRYRQIFAALDEVMVDLLSDILDVPGGHTSMTDEEILAEVALLLSAWEAFTTLFEGVASTNFQQLIDGLGGAEEFLDALGAFMSAFPRDISAREAVQAAVDGIQDIIDGLADLGMTLPSTRGGMQDLLEALVAGDEAAVAMAQKLLESTDALSAFYDALDLVNAAIDQVNDTFDALIDSIVSATERAYEQILLSGMTPEEQYNYYVNQGLAAYQQLQQTTDPEQIQQLTGQIIDAIMGAWGTLTPEQQDEVRQDFLDMIDQVQQTALEQAEKGREERLSELEEMRDMLTSAFEPIIAAQQAAADNMWQAASNVAAAAASLAAAANTPFQVQITVSDGGEVGVA